LESDSAGRGGMITYAKGYRGAGGKKSFPLKKILRHRQHVQEPEGATRVLRKKKTEGTWRGQKSVEQGTSRRLGAGPPITTRNVGDLVRSRRIQRG